MQSINPLDAPMLAGMHAESFGAECWSIDQIEGSLKQQVTSGWLAMLNDQPVGFILCQSIQDEIEILTLCVRPSHRRQGIAQKLVQHILRNKVFLEVAADNQAARQLYEKCGFKKMGRRPAYYHRNGENIDAITYSCVINS